MIVRHKAAWSNHSIAQAVADDKSARGGDALHAAMPTLRHDPPSRDRIHLAHGGHPFFGPKTACCSPLGSGLMSKTRAAQVFYWQPPSAVVWSYAAALCLAYIVVIVLTPLAIASIQRLDDALFMQLGQALAEGHWLGPYNELTLLKGPGYPLFLALGNWAGLSASMARALFHCAAVVCFVSVAHRAHRSFLVSGVLLTLLLWHPISLTSFLLRILRDQISYGQILLVIAMTGRLAAMTGWAAATTAEWT